VKHSKKAFLSLAVLSLVVPKCFSHPPRQPSKLALMEIQVHLYNDARVPKEHVLAGEEVATRVLRQAEIARPPQMAERLGNASLVQMEEAEAELAAPWLIAVCVRGRGLAAVSRLSDRIHWQREMILVVSVYNYTGLSEAQLRHAEEVAGRIFGEAQIQVRWLRCRHSQAEPAIDVGCKAPLAATELILRILSLGTGRQYHGNEHEMGEAIVPTDGSPGVYGNVYSDAVESCREKNPIARSDLLGWVIAHELGHLLLGTNSHSGAGLMRGNWSAEDLKLTRRTEFTFSPKEVKKLRADLENRTRRAAQIQTAQGTSQSRRDVR